MKLINVFILEKLHLTKGDHLNNNNIEFPLKIKFWWCRTDLDITKDDLVELSGIDNVMLLDCKEEDTQQFHLFEIILHTLKDLYKFIGCACWASIEEDTATSKNIQCLSECLYDYDIIEEEIISKLDINKINDAFQYSLKKFPNR